MTPREFLRAHLLDIIFENRNKDYGAYALRRNYNHRLWIALLAGLLIAVMVFLFSLVGGKKSSAVISFQPDNEVIIKTVDFTPEKPEPLIRPQQRPAATIHDATIRIVPNHVPTDVPTEDEMEGKQTSTITTEGTAYINTEATQPGIVTNNPVNQPPANTIPNQELSHRDASFPGGPEVLKKFLSDHLVPPSELEPGDMVRVEVRFTIEKNGKVSGFEIVTSGGREYDREVIRVCRRMPNWIPAQQNGIGVPVHYVLPVTFIGLEQ
jgi:protein TonB